MEKQPDGTTSTSNDQHISSNELTNDSKSPERLSTGDDADENRTQYATGAKLAVIIVTIGLTGFLVMLDVSIIATINKMRSLDRFTFCCFFLLWRISKSLS